MKNLNRSALGLSFLIALLCLWGCETDADKKMRTENSYRNYNETKDGIRYFKTCIEGNSFIATHAGHGITLAGPVGKCE